MFDAILGAFTLKTVLVGLVIGLFVHWIIKKYKYNLPPGPFAYPIVGNMLQFKTDMMHEEIYAMTKKYGPIISIYLGPTYAIVVNDLETALEVLVKKGAEFANRMRPASLEVVTDGGKDIAFGDYGPTWRLHRKIAAKAMRHYMQGEALEERVHNAVKVMMEEMKKEQAPFDPAMYITFIVGNILTGLCFGGKYKFNDPELVQILDLDDQFQEMLTGGVPEDTIPALQYFWESKNFRKVKEEWANIYDNFFHKKFMEHAKTFNKDNIRDFTDTLILARKEAEEDPDEADLDKLTDTHIIQTLSDIFFAGIDTSRWTLRYALLHMAAYPDIQAKVQKEIDSVVDKDDLPRMSHRPHLSYTEAVLHESMRLSSVLPTGVAHRATCDTKIGPYDVPKDTVVIINQWALHHDPLKWEKVNDFIPGRFLDENGKLGPKPENWLPFSAGRRVCLGETVAKPELHLLFACLLQKFKWRLADGVKADLSPDGNSFGMFPKPHNFIVEDRQK